MEAHALARDELVRVLTAYTGVTTANGAVGGTTLIDSNLIGSNDFITEKTVLIVSGAAAREDKGAASFNAVNGTITLQGTGFSAQITAGTIYRILNISSVEIDVANIDTKIGTNVDAAGTTTLFAWMANLLAAHGEAQGLAYYGEVTNVVDATHFDISALIGKGDAFFANNYRVYVLRDAGGLGAAPQGEMQPCSGYVSATGRFTHTAFTVALAVGDEVLLIHNRIAEILDLLGDIGNASGSTLGSIYAILGNPAQSFLAMIGYEGATSLANKLTAARAGYLDELDFDLQGTLATIAAYIDTEVAAIEAKLDVQKGATGVFYEQADAAVNITAVNTGETDVLHLSAANTRYIVRSLRLKCADPGANTVTVRLYELVNNVLTQVDSFAITNANFATYHSLMDMFGLPHLAGDELQVTVRASAGGPYAVTGQYSHAKTNV